MIKWIHCLKRSLQIPSFILALICLCRMVIGNCFAPPSDGCQSSIHAATVSQSSFAY